MSEPTSNATERGRALFAPRKEQQGDTAIEELIAARSNVDLSSSVYRKT